MMLEERAQVYAALGDLSRLRIVDLLGEGDLTIRELVVAVKMPGNLLAHHLRLLEEAGLIERRISEADRRHRYVVLRAFALDEVAAPSGEVTGQVLFVCRHNSARSQYAAAYWSSRTGKLAISAGSEPATRVHPSAVRVAAERGIDLAAAVPSGYSSIQDEPAVLVSVCDRARAGELPAAERRVHWSIPDPVASGGIAGFRSAFTEIEHRVDRLAGLR
jgi:protein-tyrosine-phosphatase/DNA-binding transcriptional ArsR family regulator